MIETLPTVEAEGAKAATKIFEPELRKIPKDIPDYFSEVSKPIKDFLTKHPSLEKETINALNKQKALKELIKYGTRFGTTGGGIYTVKSIHNLFE